MHIFEKQKKTCSFSLSIKHTILFHTVNRGSKTFCTYAYYLWAFLLTIVYTWIFLKFFFFTREHPCFSAVYSLRQQLDNAIFSHKGRRLTYGAHKYLKSERGVREEESISNRIVSYNSVFSRFPSNFGSSFTDIDKQFGSFDHFP